MDNLDVPQFCQSDDIPRYSTNPPMEGRLTEPAVLHEHAHRLHYNSALSI